MENKDVGKSSERPISEELSRKEYDLIKTIRNIAFGEVQVFIKDHRINYYRRTETIK
jgi:hypothetical protein